MINQAKAVKLIKIYQYVCDKYEEELQYHCERFTYNNRPEFPEQEIMTIYYLVLKQLYTNKACMEHKEQAFYAPRENKKSRYDKRLIFKIVREVDAAPPLRNIK